MVVCFEVSYTLRGVHFLSLNSRDENNTINILADGSDVDMVYLEFIQMTSNELLLHINDIYNDHAERRCDFVNSFTTIPLGENGFHQMAIFGSTWPKKHDYGFALL